MNYEKTMIPLTFKIQNANHIMNKKTAIYSKRNLVLMIKYYGVRDHCHYTGKYRGAAHNICNLRYNTPKKIPVVLCNGSTYDYDFIIKELAEEFQRESIGENTEKYFFLKRNL